MMISPDTYLLEIIDADYEKLMAERVRLVTYLQSYEENEKKGDRSSKGWNMDPSPDVVYQCYLEYLSMVCLLMSEKYNREYVWGNKTISNVKGCGDQDESRSKYQLFMKFDPVDSEEIKEKIAESRMRIHDCLRVLDLPDDIQQKIIDGEIELKDALDKYLPDDEK